jgi:hypothetical protein
MPVGTLLSLVCYMSTMFPLLLLPDHSHSEPLLTLIFKSSNKNKYLPYIFFFFSMLVLKDRAETISPSYDEVL